MAGLFITFEGIDGSGKSTQASLVAAALEEKEVPTVSLREPGGTEVSEKIRGFLLDPANVDIRPQTELLLYEASRAQLVSQVIKPALGEGEIVLCDRYFDSTFAYQAGARGIDEDLVRQANALGSCGVLPDVTIVYDIDPKVALERATRDETDRLEGEGVSFQERVRKGYLRAAELEGDRIHLVDASGSVEEVFSRTCEVLSEYIEQLADLEQSSFLEMQAELDRTMADIERGWRDAGEAANQASPDAGDASVNVPAERELDFVGDEASVGEQA